MLRTEPNSTMAAYGRNNLNLNIAVGSLETFQTDKKFELIDDRSNWSFL
jgi:hypothetical protein